MEQASLHWADIVVISVYFVLVLVVGLWTLCRPNRNTLSGYFLAGGQMIWIPVGASLFASNIGSEHFIGLAGTGAASGIAIIFYEFMSLPLVLALAWMFLPVYISSGVFTLPEYLQKRFGRQRLRIYTSSLSLVLYIFTKIAVSIYAGALFIQLALGWNMYLAIILLLSITGMYTILGGLAAVMYTDTFQTVVMTIGAFVLTGIGFSKLGGYEGLKEAYSVSVPHMRNNNTTCGLPDPEAFHIFRHPIHSDQPWPGILLQSSLGCLWYWCSDQVIVQRALAAKNSLHAKAGAIVAGYLKFLPLFIMIFPGMMSRAMFPDTIGCVDADACEKACGNPAGCSNIAYPTLVLQLLPVGLRGLLMAVMLSAIMSSLTSIFNSASTLFTMDLWRRVRSQASDRELLIVGRLFIVVLCIISILWIPLVQSSAGGQLFVYIQSIQGYLGTPLGALFLLAILWKRMNEKAAFWGLLIGHVFGTVRMVLEFVFPAPECGQVDMRPKLLSYLHYSYFSQLSLLVVFVVMIVISLSTKSQPEDELEGLTWWTRKSSSRSENSNRHGSEMINTTHVTEEAINGISNNQQNTEQDVVVVAGSKWKRLLDFVCGKNKQSSTEENSTVKHIDEFEKEDPKWRFFINANAVIALCVMCFLFGYYN